MIFGPKRLPGLGRQLGSGLREFKDSITGHSEDDEDGARPELTSASAGRDAAPARVRRGRFPAPRLSGLLGKSLVAKVLRPIGQDDRLSIVDHLDELRSRLIICLVALLVAFGVCFWQNHALLDLLNRALPHNSSVTTQQGLGRAASQAAQLRQLFVNEAAANRTLAAAPGVSAQAKQAYLNAAASFDRVAKNLPETAPTQEKPITLGVGEPFTTTLTVAAYFALLFALPDPHL